MTHAEALDRLKEYLQPDGSLHWTEGKGLPFIEWPKGSPSVIVDGEFSLKDIDLLEAVAVLMRATGT